MKSSRVLLAVATASALVIGGLAPAASAADVPGPVLIGPTSSATVRTAFPTFSWQPIEGDQGSEVIVSKSSATTDGHLPYGGKNYLSVDDVPAGSSSLTIDYPLAPGAAYWQVVSTDVDGVRHPSVVQKVVVPVVFAISKARVKRSTAKYNGARVVQVNAVMQCNFAQDQYYTQFTMDVYKGKKLIHRGGVAAGNCTGMQKLKQEAIFEVRGTVKKGTKLTVKIYGQLTHDATKRWGGANIPKQKGPKTTLAIVWK